MVKTTVSQKPKNTKNIQAHYKHTSSWLPIPDCIRKVCGRRKNITGRLEWFYHKNTDRWRNL